MPNNTLTVTDVKTASLLAPWGPWTREWLLVRIDTAEGLQGYGDTYASAATRDHVMAVKELIVGEDPTRVEPLFRRLVADAYAGVHASHFDSGTAVHAASAIETALWDLAGKAAGVPVYRLLGGKHHDRIRLYNCVGFLPMYLEMRDVYREMGSTMLKFDVTPDAVAHVPGATMGQHLTRKGLRAIVELVEEIRGHVGEEIEIAVEGRCGTLANAVRFVRALEPYDLAWAEDLIPSTEVDAWAQLTSLTSVPTLTGEGLHLRHEFLEYYRKGAMRFVSPDFQVCGGLAEGKKIAEMGDLHHMLACPHLAASAVGVAAAIHACAAIPNLLALEFHAMPGWDRILWNTPMEIRDGHISVPEGPGLGIELDEDEVCRHLAPGESYFE